MRKLLIVAALVAGAGLLAAQASDDRTGPAKDGAQAPARTNDVRKDAERAGSPRDDRAAESRDKSREEHRATREDDEDDDRD